MFSCSLIDTRSQNSTSIRISRTTWYEPPRAHAGSAGSSTQTRLVAVAPAGFAVPSLNPSRFREVPAGRGGELYPSIFQRGAMPPRVCLVMSLIAWWIVSGWLAHSWTSRSPCSQAGSSASFGKTRIGVSFSGLRLARPYLPSNRLDPTDSVTVSPSAGTLGPSTSVSDGGWPTPRSGGVPPAVRNRARLVSARSSSVSPVWPPAMQSKAATQVNACLAAGPGVRIPACRAPWNGYDGSAACPSAPVAAAAASASAFAPPISTPPASAVPAAPDMAPLRKLRRLGFTTVQAPSLLSVGRWYFKEIRNGGERLKHRSRGRVDVLTRGQ
jgi:hypothetical protein